MDNFLHNSNKELLWGILYEVNIFNNIPDNHISNIKKIFETELENILKSTNDTNNNRTLLDLNKIAIQQLPAKINEYKFKALNKNEIVNNSFTKRQEEFDNLINVKKPDLPNFLDSKDQPFDANNMDLLLNQMIESREKTFSQIINPIKNQEQLNNNEQNNKQNNKQNNLKLHIGNTINNADEILNIRKVSFSSTNNDLDLDIKQIIEPIIEPINELELTFLDKIKKTTTKEKDINDIYLKIDELYSMIEKLSERLNRSNIPQ